MEVLKVAVVLSMLGLQCALPAPATVWSYEPGVIYTYKYDFTIALNEDSNITSHNPLIGRNVGFSVSSSVKIANIWQSATEIKENLLKLELVTPKLLVSVIHPSSKELAEHSSKLDSVLHTPIYIHWKSGKIQNVFTAPEPKILTNIKKGLASLLQFQTTDQHVYEMDVSGICDVTYKSGSKVIRKIKHYCNSTKADDYIYYPSQLRMPNMKIHSETIYNLLPTANIIQTAYGREEIQMKLNIWKQASTFVKLKYNLDLVEQTEGQSVVEGDNIEAVIMSVSEATGYRLSRDNLVAQHEFERCMQSTCKPLSHMVQRYAENMKIENLAELKSASGFLKLLESFKLASRKEILGVLKNDSYKIILPQLLDILAVVHPEDSIPIALEVFDFNQEPDLAERFLLCLAVTSHSSQSVISHLMKLFTQKLKNIKVKATSLIALSAAANTYYKACKENCSIQVISDVSDMLLQGLKKCDSEPCTLMYLHALSNAGFPQTMSSLIEYIRKGGKYGIIALKALKKIGIEHFTEKIILVLQRVYYQFWPHQENTARAIAAELLLRSRPTEKIIGDILLSLTNRKASETTAMVLAIIKDLIATNSTLRLQISRLLKDSNFGNYHTLAQNGSSVTFTKILAGGHDANISYAINMEMRLGGMFRRANLDIKLGSSDENLNLFSLGLFTSGFGKDADAQNIQNDNQEETSAGIELSVLGVNLRPYVFFTGTAELMGLVWSAAGTEPTPALQGNLLFADHEQVIMLQSGLGVNINLKALMSTDISGTSQVSMWNKNSHSVVKNSIAMVVQGSAYVESFFAKSHVEFTLGGNSHMDIITDLDYSLKPMRVCIQMDQPAYTFRHNVRKSESVPGSQHLIRTLKKRTLYFPGRSYPLHYKNFVSCREILLKKKESYW